MTKAMRLMIEVLLGSKGLEPFVVCTNASQIWTTFAHMTEVMQIGTLAALFISISAFYEIMIEILKVIGWSK